MVFDFPASSLSSPRSTSNGTKFPTDFIWGVAGSAWQIEGGLQFGGRGPSVLDTIGALSPNGTAATPGTNDSVIANMHYFLYKQDIARLAALGVPYYSFSISWSRIVPFGLAESPVNTEALAHYDDVIETCMQYGITPFVTLMHADQPLLVNISDASLTVNFLFYAKQVMTRYGNRVPYWVTFNEPNILPTFGAASWEGVKEIVRAHAAVYDWYKEELKGVGQISMKFANNLAIPLNLTDTSHVEAAYRYQDYILGIMGSPLFLGEQIPRSVLSTRGVITPFGNEELSQLAGKIDYYSLDAYTPQLVAPPVGGIDACVNNTQHPLWPICVDVSTYKQADDWLIGQPSNDYSHIASQYVRQQVGYVWQTYRPRGIMVSEFGYNAVGEADLPLDTQRYDLLRSTYYQQYLDELLKAKQEDGANVIGALAWSFADNNEFGSYKQQYGLQSVNRTDGTLTRSYKRSFFDLVDWFHAYVESH